MAPPLQPPPILSQIKAARNYSEQTAALRALKDEIIGDVQRKEKWVVEHGILESLVEILHSIRSPPSRHTGDDSRSSHAGPPRPLADHELVRLQSLQLVASFASGRCIAHLFRASVGRLLLVLTWLRQAVRRSLPLFMLPVPCRLS